MAPRWHSRSRSRQRKSHDNGVASTSRPCGKLALWYNGMMKKAALDPKRETLVVPVVTMEEVAVLSERERADLIASLKQADAEVAAGETKPFNREAFKNRFLAVCRGDRKRTR